MGTYIDTIPQTVTSPTKQGRFGIDVADLSAVAPSGVAYTVAITRSGFSRTEYTYVSQVGDLYLDVIIEIGTLVQGALPDPGVDISFVPDEGTQGYVGFQNEPTGPFPTETMVFEVVAGFALIAFEPENISWCVDQVNREPEPDQSQRDLGWVIGQKPPSQWFNWAWNNFTNTFVWLKKKLSDYDSNIQELQNQIDNLPSPYKATVSCNVSLEDGSGNVVSGVGGPVVSVQEVDVVFYQGVFSFHLKYDFTFFPDNYTPQARQIRLSPVTDWGSNITVTVGSTSSIPIDDETNDARPSWWVEMLSGQEILIKSNVWGDYVTSDEVILQNPHFSFISVV